MSVMTCHFSGTTRERCSHGKQRLKRWVLRRLRKMASDGADVTCCITLLLNTDCRRLCRFCLFFFLILYAPAMSQRNRRRSTSRSHSRSLKLVPFESIGIYGFYIVTLALSCIISELKRDIGRKSRFFLTFLSFECCHTVCYRKTRMV